MIVRTATLDDLDALIAMGERFIETTTYHGRIAVNPAQLRSLATHLLTTDNGVIFVAETDHGLIGMIGVFAFAHPMSGERTGSEVFWWMEPDQRGAGIRLLRAAERWSIAQGALRFQMIAPTPDVEQIYQRLGFEEVETVYQRSLA